MQTMSSLKIASRSITGAGTSGKPPWVHPVYRLVRDRFELGFQFSTVTTSATHLLVEPNQATNKHLQAKCA